MSAFLVTSIRHGSRRVLSGEARAPGLMWMVLSVYFARAWHKRDRFPRCIRGSTVIEIEHQHIRVNMVTITDQAGVIRIERC